MLDGDFFNLQASLTSVGPSGSERDAIRDKRTLLLSLQDGWSKMLLQM